MDINSEVPLGEGGAPHTLVVDVPFGMTAEDAERLLNEPYARGYYIHRSMEWIDGARVIYVHRVKPIATNGPTKESQAMQFLRDNREMSANQLVAAFKALGFPRSSVWIGKKRMEVIRSQRKA